jgi:DNA-directed RNA polymerase
VIDAGFPVAYAEQLAHAVYNAVEDTLSRPKAVRGWLEQRAESAAKRREPLRWPTPLGLLVISIYQPADIKNLSVFVDNRKRSTKLAVGDKDGIKKRKAKDAVTANFVHSLDAAHLHLVALAAAKEGISMVSVHDCFGTVAPHAARLREIIVDEFIDLHKRCNWLNAVWVSTKCDGPPFSNIGTLELEPSFAAYR